MNAAFHCRLCALIRLRLMFIQQQRQLVALIHQLTEIFYRRDGIVLHEFKAILKAGEQRDGQSSL